MIEQTSQLDEEIESWKGFPWALRKGDLELWNAMTKDVRDRFGEAVGEVGEDHHHRSVLHGPALGAAEDD
jgi:hypothetical protein